MLSVPSHRPMLAVKSEHASKRGMADHYEQQELILIRSPSPRVEGLRTTTGYTIIIGRQGKGVVSESPLVHVKMCNGP